MAAFILLLLALHLATTSSSHSSSASVTEPPIAKPNCIDICGAVRIPFPFGIGVDCFFSPWYEISCQWNGTTNTSRPWLKKLNVEVLSITLVHDLESHPNDNEGKIVVLSPISYSDSRCGANRSVDVPLSLVGSPMVFSESDNNFFAFGCHVEANMRVRKDNLTSQVGCLSECANGNDFGSSERRRYSACSGIGCCQTTVIPPSVQNYSIIFDHGAARIHNCSTFAFLVRKTWFKPFVTNLYSVRDQGFAPVILKWGILDQSLIRDIGGGFKLSYRSRYINKKPLMQCACYYGYRGNPYLSNDCQDINECEFPEYQHKNMVCPPMTCVNEIGSYYCTGFDYKLTSTFKDARRRRLILISMIGFAIGIAPLILIILCVRFLYQRIKKMKQIRLKRKLYEESVKRTAPGKLEQPFARDGKGHHGRLYTANELKRATKNYRADMILGEGGQGTVYKGKMSDGAVVAVKKSRVMDEANLKKFINEVIILSQVRHRHIVRLLGICLDTDAPLLVYEFVQNGTLHHYLHDPHEEEEEEFRLTWEARLRIAAEVAGAVAYMHSSAQVPIYHRDIKARNVLLGDQHRAKVADFGISRMASLGDSHATTMEVQGTVGYLDPEFYVTYQFSDKSDVYSFGVLLAELLTGKRPVLSPAEGFLAAHFLEESRGNRLFDILDRQLVEQATATATVREDIQMVVHLTERCLNLTKTNRPTMTEVAIELEAIRRRRIPPAEDQQQANGSDPDSDSDSELDKIFKEIVNLGSTSSQSGVQLQPLPSPPRRHDHEASSSGGRGTLAVLPTIFEEEISAETSDSTTSGSGDVQPPQQEHSVS